MASYRRAMLPIRGYDEANNKYGTNHPIPTRSGRRVIGKENACFSWTCDTDVAWKCNREGWDHRFGMGSDGVSVRHFVTLRVFRAQNTIDVCVEVL